MLTQSHFIYSFTSNHHFTIAKQSFNIPFESLI